VSYKRKCIFYVIHACRRPVQLEMKMQLEVAFGFSISEGHVFWDPKIN